MTNSPDERRSPHRKRGGKPAQPTRRPPMAGSAERGPVRVERGFVETYRNWIIAGILAVVVVAVGAILALKVRGKSSSSSAGGAGTQAERQLASPQLLAELASIPIATFDSVGTGTAGGLIRALDNTSLQQDGKPLIFYYGAEFCPYCAAQRWPMVVALSRFGSFSNLGLTSSAANDVFANTPTFSFHGASYTSQYVAFAAVETTTNQPDGKGFYTKLDTPTPEQQALVQQYDAPPYTQSAGGIPFVDFGNKYATYGAMYSNNVLMGLTQQQIADALKNPSSDQAKAILGAANIISAAICKLTNNQPANICNSPGVLAGATKLGR
jgi:hypothetical protein